MKIEPGSIWVGWGMKSLVVDIKLYPIDRHRIIINNNNMYKNVSLKLMQGHFSPINGRRIF